MGVNGCCYIGALHVLSDAPFATPLESAHQLTAELRDTFVHTPYRETRLADPNTYTSFLSGTATVIVKNTTAVNKVCEIPGTALYTDVRVKAGMTVTRTVELPMTAAQQYVLTCTGGQTTSLTLRLVG